MRIEKSTKPSRRSQKGPLTKEALLQKAIKLITTKGMDKLSIREVARSCKTSSATVFYHFQSKEVLIREIINKVVFSNHSTVSHLATIEDDAYQKLHKHFLGNLVWAHKNPDEAQILLLLYYLGSVHKEFAETYQGLLSNARERIKAHLLAGQREHIFLFKNSPDELAMIIHNTLVGAFVNMAASQNETEIDEFYWEHFLKQVTLYNKMS